MLRLDRILANSGLGSRKDVKALIKAGRVRLNGEMLDRPDRLLTEEEQRLLTLDGNPLRTGRYLYYLFNKPAGYLTAMESSSQATIREFLPNLFFDKKITPAGRLDKDTTGLLILSNDGLLIHRLLSPRYNIPRVYHVVTEILDHPFTEADCEAVAAGIALNDEEVAKPGKLTILSENTARLELREGKFHEVKRIMHALGKEVTELHRESYGPLALRDEAVGSLRELSADEVKALLDAVGLEENH